MEIPGVVSFTNDNQYLVINNSMSVEAMSILNSF